MSFQRQRNPSLKYCPFCKILRRLRSTKLTIVNISIMHNSDVGYVCSVNQKDCETNNQKFFIT